MVYCANLKKEIDGVTYSWVSMVRNYEDGGKSFYIGESIFNKTQIEDLGIFVINYFPVTFDLKREDFFVDQVVLNSLAAE